MFRWLSMLGARLSGRARPPAEIRPVEPTPRARARQRAEDPPLIARVRAEAFAHVAAGMYDPWSFDNGALPPYLTELRAERGRAIMQLRHDAAERLRATRSHVEVMDARADNSERAAMLEEDRLRAAARQEEVVRAKLDWLAAAEVRRRPELPGAPPPAADAEAAEGDSAGSPQASCGHDRHPHECWEGLHTGHPLSGRIKLAILLALVGVDVPIQYEIFRFFHGDTVLEQVQTWVFTLPVALIMVLLPHVAGYLYRGRHVTGAERLLNSLPLLILVPWGYLAWRLGDLRAKVLLAPPVGEDGLPLKDASGQPVATLADQLSVSPFSVTVMYVALLLITGGIAFLLGIAREHPTQMAYRGAYADLRAAQERVARTVPVARDTAAQQAQAHIEHKMLSSSFDGRLAEGIETVHTLYDQAELAYMEALGEAVGTPAFTEAVAKTAQTILQPHDRHDAGRPALPAGPWT